MGVLWIEENQGDGVEEGDLVEDFTGRLLLSFFPGRDRQDRIKAHISGCLNYYYGLATQKKASPFTKQVIINGLNGILPAN